MTEVERTRRVAASPDAVWTVLADFGGIARWATNVDHSCLLRADDPGPGLVRRVQTGRTTLLETVEAWDAGTRLAYRIEGLPPVVRSVRNEWRLDPSDGGTTVTLRTTVDAGPRPPQQLIARLVARRLAKESESMLAGLAAATTATAAGAPLP